MSVLLSFLWKETGLWIRYSENISYLIKLLTSLQNPMPNPAFFTHMRSTTEVIGSFTCKEIPESDPYLKTCILLT